MVRCFLLAPLFALAVVGTRDSGHQAHDLSSHPTPIANFGEILPTRANPRRPRATSETGALLCSKEELCADGRSVT